MGRKGSDRAEIVCTAGVADGRPRFRGRGLHVLTVVREVRRYGLDWCLGVHRLERRQVRAALEYCRERRCVRDVRIVLEYEQGLRCGNDARAVQEWRRERRRRRDWPVGFCHGCTLIHEGEDEDNADAWRIDGWRLADELVERLGDRLQEDD